MKKLERFTESELKEIIVNLINEQVSVPTIVHNNVDNFVNTTISNFIDMVQKLEMDLQTNQIVSLNGLDKAIIDFESEMMKLSDKLILSINQGIQKQKQLNKN